MGTWKASMLRKDLWDGSVVKVFATWQCKPEDLSPIPRAHVKVEGENWLHEVVCWSPCVHHALVCVCAHMHMYACPIYTQYTHKHIYDNRNKCFPPKKKWEKCRPWRPESRSFRGEPGFKTYVVKETDCNLPCLENQNDVELKNNGLVYLPEKTSRQESIQAHGEKAVTVTKETSAIEETSPALHWDTRRERSAR